MRIETELMRGAGPTAVLKLLERGEMYGYELVDALSRRTDGVLAMGQSTLYPLLYNLEAKGLVSSRWQQPGGIGSASDGPEATSRPRKYYTLTSKGKKKLAADVSQWGALAGALRSIGVLDGATSPKGALA